jgi:pimeloyl-ACP methyl ester carboxylesterase
VRDVQIAKVQGGGLFDIMRNEMKPNYLANGSDRTDILELCMVMAQALGPDVFINQSKALQSRRDQTKVLEQINVPTLILCGREDKLCPVEKHKMMQSLIVGSELSVIDRSGHLPVLEMPDITNQLLQNWLHKSG